MMGRVLSRISTFAVLIVVATLGVTTSQTASGSGWHEIAAMPDPRWFPAAGVGSDGKIYVYGGYVRTAQNPREYGLGRWSLVVYDPATDGWTRGPEVKKYHLRKRQKYSTTTPHRDGTITKEISWEDMEVVQAVPNEVFSGVADPLGMIHWFDNTGLGAVVFDPSKGEWTQPPSPMVLAEKPDWTLEDHRKGVLEFRFEGTFPANKRLVATTATSRDGKIYVIAGAGEPIEAQGRMPINLLAGIDVYDAAANTWKSIAPMHQARQLHAAAFGPDGKLYVFGGYAGIGSYESHPNDPEDQAKADTLASWRDGRDDRVQDRFSAQPHHELRAHAPTGKAACGTARPRRRLTRRGAPVDTRGYTGGRRLRCVHPLAGHNSCRDIPEKVQRGRCTRRSDRSGAAACPTADRG